MPYCLKGVDAITFSTFSGLGLDASVRALMEGTECFPVYFLLSHANSELTDLVKGNEDYVRPPGKLNGAQLVSDKLHPLDITDDSGFDEGEAAMQVSSHLLLPLFDFPPLQCVCCSLIMFRRQETILECSLSVVLEMMFPR